MEDIDRTFEKLRRVDYDVVMDKVAMAMFRHDSGRSLSLQVPRIEPFKSLYGHICIENGWTAEDFVEESNKRG